MLQRGVGENPGNATLTRALGLAKRRIAQARYYEEARRFAQIIPLRFNQEERKGFDGGTGGGPRILAGDNAWASEDGQRSYGLNSKRHRQKATHPGIRPTPATRLPSLHQL